MAAPYNNIRSKNDRAIVAYLKAQLPNGTNIYPANNSQEKSMPCLIVRTHQMRPDVTLTGSWRGRVQVETHCSATIQPGETNPDAMRVAADLLIARAVDALMQSDNNANFSYTATQITAAGRLLATTGTAQSQANNADMVNYTCQNWLDPMLDGGNPKDSDGVDGNRWAEIAIFECVACSSNVD